LTQAQEKEKQDGAREEVYESLRNFAKEIKGPWFLGEEFSLVDVAIAPWVVRDFLATKHRGYNRGDVGRDWENYADRLEKRDSVSKTRSVSGELGLINRLFIPRLMMLEIDRMMNDTSSCIVVIFNTTTHRARPPKRLESGYTLIHNISNILSEPLVLMYHVHVPLVCKRLVKC
jgi:Glutathione S-transferase, C-terminal domain